MLSLPPFQDPTLAFDATTQKYIIAGTDDKLVYFSSSALTGPYLRNGSILSQAPKIDNPGRVNPWAPDLHCVDGKYYAYYTVSVAGTQISAIGVAVSESGEPGTFEDYGALFNSSSYVSYNALDPNLVPGHGYLSYGSYFGGIYLVRLNNLLSVDESDLPGIRIAGGYPDGDPVEGSYIYRKGGYYYLFVSNGQCCGFDQSKLPKPDTTEYKILVGRSPSLTGPYYDRSGMLMTRGGGTLVLSSFRDIYAPGGQSVFQDPKTKRYVMVFHFSNPKHANSYASLGMYYLDFSTGWPVVRNTYSRRNAYNTSTFEGPGHYS